MYSLVMDSWEAEIRLNMQTCPRQPLPAVALHVRGVHMSMHEGGASCLAQIYPTNHGTLETLLFNLDVR